MLKDQFITKFSQFFVDGDADVDALSELFNAMKEEPPIMDIKMGPEGGFFITTKSHPVKHQLAVHSIEEAEPIMDRIRNFYKENLANG